MRRYDVGSGSGDDDLYHYFCLQPRLPKTRVGEEEPNRSESVVSQQDGTSGGVRYLRRARAAAPAGRGAGRGWAWAAAAAGSACAARRARCWPRTLRTPHTHLTSGNNARTTHTPADDTPRVCTPHAHAHSFVRTS